MIEAAKKLGYRPNALARSLRTTRSNLIGIILEEFTNPLFLRILELITRKLQENGLHAIAINATKDLSLSEAMELVMQYRIDGLIVSSDMPLRMEFEWAAMSVPVIVFARSDRRIAGAFGICLDDEAAGALAARHLVERGYAARLRRWLSRRVGVGGSAGRLDDRACRVRHAAGRGRICRRQHLRPRLRGGKRLLAASRGPTRSSASTTRSPSA